MKKKNNKYSKRGLVKNPILSSISESLFLSHSLIFFVSQIQNHCHRALRENDDNSIFDRVDELLQLRLALLFLPAPWLLQKNIRLLHLLSVFRFFSLLAFRIELCSVSICVAQEKLSVFPNQRTEARSLEIARSWKCPIPTVCSMKIPENPLGFEFFFSFCFIFNLDTAFFNG